MRTIAHISDLHFGREDARIVEGLLADLMALAPSLVAVSGDLTQRARPAQFAAARSFLDRIPFPLLVVPGNHDIPLYNMVSRFLWPLTRYRRYISVDVDPVFEDNELLVLGVNTARSTVRKEGRISREQIGVIRSLLATRGRGRFKALVAHHPFTAPEERPKQAVVGRSASGLAILEKGGADLLLSGHVHRRHAGPARTVHLTRGGAMLVAHASTAVSRRLRGEPNSYNFVTIDGHCIRIEARDWDGRRFTPATALRFAKRDGRWLRDPADPDHPSRTAAAFTVRPGR
jgi:3',5'-cyclic AMP phosphodiesterase CpdA